MVTFNFSGSCAATDGACDVMQGPYTVGPGVRALDGFAAATIPTNDMVLKLFFGSTPLISADTLFSPEQFHYEPAGGVPPGDYSVQVCDFHGGGPWADPRTTPATSRWTTRPAPPAYWPAGRPSRPPRRCGARHVPVEQPEHRHAQDLVLAVRHGCDSVVGNLASSGPWDFDLHTNTPTFTTSGNNNKAATSWANDTVPSAPQYMPVSTARDYSFPWTNDWNTGSASGQLPRPRAPSTTTAPRR